MLSIDEQEVMSKGSLRPEVAVMRKREVIEPRKYTFWPDEREIRRRGSRKPILWCKKQADGKCHLYRLGWHAVRRGLRAWRAHIRDLLHTWEICQSLPQKVVGESKANHWSEPEGLTEVGPLHSSVEASESWGSEGSYRQVVVS